MQSEQEARADTIPAQQDSIILPYGGNMSALQLAFADGKYPEWLAEEADREEAEPHILKDMTREFEGMKLLSPEQRMEDYNWIVRYYSRSNKAFEPTSLKLYDSMSEENIRSGRYNAENVSISLLLRLKNYDATCIVPIMQQVRNYLIGNFWDTNILFLGRDFCSVYLYIVSNPLSEYGLGYGSLDRKNLFLCNVSRYVRDVALGGKTTELRLVLERIGLTKDSLLAKGLLIADSCMQGKIPAIIFKSLALGMNESERYEFLTRCHVRYLKSSRTKGLSVADKAIALGAKASLLPAAPQGSGLLSNDDLEKLVGHRLEFIEEFKIDYPSLVEEFVPRRHKIFEWRPKVSLISMGIEVDEHGPHLIANEPSTPSEKILSLLGLYAEIQLYKDAKKTYPLSAGQACPAIGGTDGATCGGANGEKSPLAPPQAGTGPTAGGARRIGEHIVSHVLVGYQRPTTPKPGWFLTEIDEALESGGIEGLRNWQKRADPAVGSVAVMRTRDLEFLYELVINGKVVYRFKDIVGEGNNVKVYVTGAGTIVKVIKDAKHVRKNLLLKWAEPFVRNVGIRVAKIFDVSPTGLYLEQEMISGESLESLYGETNDIPSFICNRVLQDFRAAKKLIAQKGIWLDLKSANYHFTDNTCPAVSGIVNVDYAPRLNETYYRYFQDDPTYGGTSPANPAFRGTGGGASPSSNGITGELAVTTPGLRRDLKDDEFLERFFHHDVKKRKIPPMAGQVLPAPWNPRFQRGKPSARGISSQIEADAIIGKCISEDPNRRGIQ